MGLHTTVENHENRLNQLTELISKVTGRNVSVPKEAVAPTQEDPRLNEMRSELAAVHETLAKINNRISKLEDTQLSGRVGSLEDAKAAHEMELADVKKSITALSKTPATPSPAATTRSAPSRAASPSSGPAGGSGQAKAK